MNSTVYSVDRAGSCCCFDFIELASTYTRIKAVSHTVHFHMYVQKNICCKCVALMYGVCVLVDIPETLTWCVLSDGEQRKCEDMALAFRNKGLMPNIQCLYGTSNEDCMEKIQVEQFS